DGGGQLGRGGDRIRDALARLDQRHRLPLLGGGRRGGRLGGRGEARAGPEGGGRSVGRPAGFRGRRLGPVCRRLGHGGGGVRVVGQRMMPARMTRATISARSPVPSLRAMRARWLFTVRADRLSVSPICLLDLPSATRRSTSISRADRSATPLSLGPPRSPAASSEATDGSA